MMKCVILPQPKVKNQEDLHQKNKYKLNLKKKKLASVKRKTDNFSILVSLYIIFLYKFQFSFLNHTANPSNGKYEITLKHFIND